MTVKVTVSGTAQKRIETTDSETRTVEIVETDIVHSKEFESPSEFHRIGCSQTATSAAEKMLPDEYYVEHTTAEDEWSVNYDGNAVEAMEFAEAVASDSELNVVEILTLWLQNLGAPRIRRALHNTLHNDHSVDVNVDAF